MKKKTIKTLATLVTAAVIFVGSYFYQGKENDLNPDTYAPTTSESSKTQGSITTFPDSFLKAEKEGIVPFGYINAKVTKVSDGDTLRIEYNSQEYKVRLLDIDTPESVKAGVEPQPFSEEASNFTKEKLTGEEVKLIFEKDTTDQYDRLLAHIILKDGTYYNATMVQNGYAICVFYNPNTLLKDYFTELQNKAIDEQEGFWQLPEDQRPFIKGIDGKFIAAYKMKKEAA